jgi:Transposase
MSPLRMRGCPARQRDPAAGARAAGVAPGDVADHDPLLSLHRLGACVAPGHQPGRRAAGEAVASRAAMGAEGIVCQHLTVTRVAEGLGVSWNTANDAVLAGDRRVIGVDEHCWRLTRRGDQYVTVIIDLTPIRDGTGPARLLDMVQGRSKQVFKAWPGERDTSWRDGVEVAAMDGFTGFKTATSQELPDAVAVMDPFHVVPLSGDAPDQCRRRVQQATCGHRGRKGDPLYAARRTLHTGSDLLTGKQRQRLTAPSADDEHVEVEATRGTYQHMIAAYREPDRKRGRELMRMVRHRKKGRRP